MTEQETAGSEIKVMLVAPNWLGDAVMFSALIEYLHTNRDLSDGRKLVLQLAVRTSWAPLFKDDHRIERIVPVDRGGRHGGLLGGWNLGTDLRCLKPKAILLGPPSLRAGLAALRSGARIRIGYNSDGRGPLLNYSIPVPMRGSIHHSLELVKLGEILLTALGHPGQMIDLKTSKPLIFGGNSTPAVPDPSNPLWVFAPGATYGSAKSWPLENAQDFVRTALDGRKVRMVILGDSAASVFAKELASRLNISMKQDISEEAGLVDLTGKTDLGQVVSILKTSQVFVGNDSGLMHLAAALGVPTVGLFGSSNPDWTSPRGPLTQVVAAQGFSCRPCYLKSCNQKEFCMDSIKASEVLTAVDHLLACTGV